MKWSMLFSHNLYTWNFHASMCGCTYSMTSLLHILLIFSHNYSWWCDSNIPFSLLYLHTWRSELINRSGAKKNSSFIYWRMTLHHWLPHSLSICIDRCLQLFSMCMLLWYRRIPSHQPFWIATTTLYPKTSVIGGKGFLLLNLVKNTQRLPKSVNWL